jgi:hypothetical protein
VVCTTYLLHVAQLSDVRLLAEILKVGRAACNEQAAAHASDVCTILPQDQLHGLVARRGVRLEGCGVAWARRAGRHTGQRRRALR